MQRVLHHPQKERAIVLPHHHQRGSQVLLLVREENKRGGVTLPFHCLSFADDVSHQGARPMAIRWRLQPPIPAVFRLELAVAV